MSHSESLNWIRDLDQSQLYSHAYRYTKNYDEVYDLVMDTLIKAEKGYAARNPAVPLLAWLYTIMRNHYIDGWRRSRKIQFLDDGEIERITPAKKSEDSAVLGNIQLLTLLEAAKDKLGPRKLEMVHLHYLLDLPQQKVAEMMGTTANSVKTDLAKARKILQETAEDLGIEYRND